MLLGKTSAEHLTGNAVLDKTVDEAGVEIVTGTDGAHSLDGLDWIFPYETSAIENLERSRAEGTDEVAAAGRYLFFEHLTGITDSEQGYEVLVASPYDVCKFDILPKGIADVPQILDVGRTEIDIVIQDGPLGAGMFEEFPYKRTAGRIQGIEGTEKDDIIFLYLRIDEVRSIFRSISIKDVLGIILFVKEGQGKRSL